MHLNSILVFNKYASNYFNADSSVLEIGASGVSGYQKVTKKFKKWHTLELIDSKNNIRKSENHFEVTDLYNYPIESNTYDIVLSGQVAEHVKKVWLWFNELKRITKPGGYIITINPVSWPYHEDPVDCWRMYPEAMTALSEESGLTLIHSSWQSLEWEYFNLNEKYLKSPGFTIPGRSIADDSRKIYNFNKQKFYYNAFLRKLPFVRRFMSPIQIAYDTITIMQKP